MSHHDAVHVNSKPTDSCCLSCLSSFGITKARIPHRCIGKKCNKRICRQCIYHINTYNGLKRPYECMYCLKTYSKNQLPPIDESLNEQLLPNTIVKYGALRTSYLLSIRCTFNDLLDDIECRRNHFKNLLSRANQFLGHESTSETVKNASIMHSRLSDLIGDIRNGRKKDINSAKEDYRKIISSSNNLKDLAIAYIEICEQLQSEIADSEQTSLFPITFTLWNEWLHEQGQEDEFEPNIPSLFKAIHQDLANQLTDSTRAPRVKVGVVGYTSAGKSTTINRLLGFKNLVEEGAAIVLSNKSTYFPLQFDRKEPLFDPTDSTKRTWVTLVDMPGSDEGKMVSSAEISAGNYLDEIRKADCDIYLVVFNKELTDEQKQWINYIEENLHRICLVVQSKVDVEFLEKFHRKYGQFYSQTTQQQRIEFGKSIIEELRQESNFLINDKGQSGCNGCSPSENSSQNTDSQQKEVFLVSCNYKPPNIDASELQKEQSFDFTDLYNKLGELAPAIHRNRIHTLATRTLAHVINTCFRRGYIVNALKFEVAAGFASIIPFLDQLPRYLSRDAIRKAYSIDDNFKNSLKSSDLTVHQYRLQTSVFKTFVKEDDRLRRLPWDSKVIAKSVGIGLLTAGSSVADDIVRAVAPTATLLSGVGRVAFTAATLGVGAAITLAVSAWYAVSAGKHIFSYVNRLCDDLIMIGDAYIVQVLLNDSL